MPKHMILGLGLAVLLAGCATTAPKSQPLVTQLQLRVGELERELDAKDERIKNLEYDIKDLSYELDKVKSGMTRRTTVERTVRTEPAVSSKDDEEIIRVPVSAEKVQRALKNAGFYKGAIDGKVGSGTKRAISDFQKQNGLKADGLVGKETWGALKEYAE